MKKLIAIGALIMATIDAKNISLTLTSPDFGSDEKIPKELTGEGANKVPQLKWSGAPTRTVTFALVCDDPDAPAEEPFVHWVVYNIPATAESLDFLGQREDKNKNGTMQGENSYKKIGYDGPMPPKGHGIHHYHFKLYALDDTLSLKPGASKNNLVSEMQGKIIGKTELIGVYERK